MAFFPYLSSIIYTDVIDPIDFFFYGEQNKSLKKVVLIIPIFKKRFT